MYVIKNNSLEVSILDPVADRSYMGTRYCTGGYIFTVVDKRHGNLITGPTYPGEVIPSEGQGMPDGFDLSPLQPRGSTSTKALVLGIGICDLGKNDVEEWCTWDVNAGKEQIVFKTRHQFGGFDVKLVRTVTLMNRTLRTATCVRNEGEEFVPIRWFPHPFYPPPATSELCKFNIPISFPDNSGYELAPNGYICAKKWPWVQEDFAGKDGFFQLINHDASDNLIVMQRHPVLGLTSATCSYTPAFFPIWGNTVTFSWEPFLERTLGWNQETDWYIDYEF